MYILKAFSVSTAAEAGHTAQSVPKINNYKRGGLSLVLVSLVFLSVMLVSAALFCSCQGAGVEDSSSEITGASGMPQGGTIYFADAGGNLSSTASADTVFSIHVFTTVGDNTLTVSTAAANALASASASVTAIAGGGGGGGHDGRNVDFPGGGGAGGVIIDAPVTLNAGTYKITVGGGGAGGAVGGDQGADGQNTVLSLSGTELVSAHGGGGGGTGNDGTANLDGRPGGSGGGGGNGAISVIGTGGTGGGGGSLGNDGGTAVTATPHDAGAGGGGAGGVGKPSDRGGGPAAWALSSNS